MQRPSDFSLPLGEYFNNYFEELLIFNAVIVGIIIFMYVALKLSEVSWKQLTGSLLNRVLLIIVVAGEMVLMSALGYVFWQNYERPARKMLDLIEIEPDTRWVNEDVRIYYLIRNILNAVDANGENFRIVFEAKDPINEYHFSPNGRHVLIATKNDLYLHNIDGQTTDLIDTVTISEGIKGVISGIRWAPDSRRIVYEITRWSAVSSQDQNHIYDIESRSRRTFQSPVRKLSSLYWDKSGKNLYYLHHEAVDPAVDLKTHRVKVIRVPLSTLEPEFVTSIMTDQSKVPVVNLEFRGIDIHDAAGHLSFGNEKTQDQWVADSGAVLGVDADDHLYFVKNKWFRKRLYKISRIRQDTEFPRYQYQGGTLAIQGLRWLPGSRYVVMRHQVHGVLILEPLTARLGVLMNVQARAFGWYSP